MENRFLIPMAVWIVLFAGFFLYAAVPTWTGTEVQLKLVPVDPTDVFKGEYLTLRYDISTLNTNLSDYNFTYGERVYVQLSNDVPARALKFSHTKPSGLYITGTYTGAWMTDVNFGAEQYFIPEGAGRDVNFFRNGTYTALVKVDGRGTARVQKILEDGKEVQFSYRLPGYY